MEYICPTSMTVVVNGGEATAQLAAKNLKTIHTPTLTPTKLQILT
jgi:hypothetical protein